MNNKLAFSLFLAGAALTPAFVTTAQAEEVAIADGTYEVNFLTYKTGTTETSGMANRFEQPAKLIVENGEARLQLKIISQNSLMGDLTIPYKGNAVKMTTIEGDATTTTRIVEIPVDTFNKAVNVVVDVHFPGSTTPVVQTFDLIVESPAAESLSEEVKITPYKYGTTEVSLMQQFLKPTAKIVLEDDVNTVHVTFTNKDYIKKLVIDGTEAIRGEENGQEVTYSFTVKNTKQLITAEMDINAGGTPMTQKAQFHLGVKGASVMINNPFTDIETNANKDAILNLLNKGIVKSSDKFNPNNSLTRSQFALMIARTLNVTATTDAGYKDLAALKTSDIERYNAINALAEAKIVVKQDYFNPNAPITRQQAALMIYRAMQYHVGTDALDFGKNIEVYADGASIKNEEVQRALSFLYVSNAMTGSVAKDGKRYIQAGDNLTRGQMAKTLNGTLKYLGH